MSGSAGRCGCAIAITVTVSASTMRCALGTWPVTAHTKARGLPVVCCLCAVFDGGAGFTLTAILNHRSAGSGLLCLLLLLRRRRPWPVATRSPFPPPGPSSWCGTGRAQLRRVCARCVCGVQAGARLHGAREHMALTWPIPIRFRSRSRCSCTSTGLSALCAVVSASRSHARALKPTRSLAREDKGGGGNFAYRARLHLLFGGIFGTFFCGFLPPVTAS